MKDYKRDGGFVCKELRGKQCFILTLMNVFIPYVQFVKAILMTYWKHIENELNIELIVT